jgi:EmrB/QacA subfamily drug resistance transporter
VNHPQASWKASRTSLQGNGQDRFHPANKLTTIHWIFFIKGETTKNTAITLKEEKAGISGRRAYLIFAIVGLALLMASVDSTIVAVSMPEILDDFKTTLAMVGWTATGYQFAQSIIMPIIGKLSDEWGRKRIFLLAVFIFTATSVAAGFAPNIYWLIIFRILQGIGGGSFLPSATGVVSDAFSARKRATMIGLFGSINPIGGILGPNLGGFLVQNLSWRWIFFVNIPIGVVLMVLGIVFLPSIKTAPAKSKVDMVGAGIFSGAVLSLITAMTIWSDNPANPGWHTFALIALGFFMLIFFVRHESKTDNPMIEIRLLRWRPLFAANIFNFFFGAVAFGFFQFIPYYAKIAYNMSPEQSGLLLTPRSFTIVITSAVVSISISRLRYRLPMIGGLCFIATCLFLLSQGYREATIGGITIRELPLLIAIITIGGLGMGMANPASNNAALDLIPEKVAAVAGLRGMFRSVGGVFGTAGVVLALSGYANEVVGMQQIYMWLSFILLGLIPVIFFIPDKVREIKGEAAVLEE